MTRHERPLRRVNPSGDVVWVARFTGPDGKRGIAKPAWNRGKGTFEKRRDAQRAIDEAYDGAKTERHGPTVGEYAATWLVRYPRYARSALSYESRLRSVLDAPVDGVPLRDWEFDALRRSHVLQVLDFTLTVQGRAQKGAAGVIAVLSAMAEDAIGDDTIGHNPFRSVRLRANDPRIQKKPRATRLLSWDEMHSLAAAAGDYEPMLRVLSDCGLRLGELLALERQDWTGDRLAVRSVAWRGRVYEGTKTTHGLPENERGRVVPVPVGCARVLRGMPKRIDSRLLFPGPDGGVWRDSSWRRLVWAPAVKRSGVLARPQDFRHSYVSLLRAAGIDPAELARAAGHTVQTATAHYTHATGRWFDEIRGAVGT